MYALIYVLGVSVSTVGSLKNNDAEHLNPFGTAAFWKWPLNIIFVAHVF